MRAVFLFEIADRLLKLLIPVSARRVCYLSIPDYGDSAYSVYRHLLQARDSIEHVWLLNGDADAGRIRAEFQELTSRYGKTGHTLRIARKSSLTGYCVYLTCSRVFYTHGLYRFSKWPFRRNIVCLWHGMPLKCIGALDKRSPDRSLPFGTMHIATSHYFRYVVSKAFRVVPESVKVVGLPRCDALRFEDSRQHSRHDVFCHLGVAEHKKLVLWLPTFRRRTQDARLESGQAQSFLDNIAPSVLSALCRSAESAGCHIIVKLHPRDWLNQSNVALREPAITFLKSSDWLAKGIQLYDLVAASDALISDVSSVIVDYLLKAGPIGIMGYDAITYDRDLTIPMNQLLRSDRISYLGDEAAIRDFFAKVPAPGRHGSPSNDVATMLYDVPSEKSAELTVREVGL